MENTNGTSLQVIQKNSFFDKIVKFVRNVFRNIFHFDYLSYILKIV